MTIEYVAFEIPSFVINCCNLISRFQFALYFDKTGVRSVKCGSRVMAAMSDADVKV